MWEKIKYIIIIIMYYEYQSNVIRSETLQEQVMTGGAKCRLIGGQGSTDITFLLIDKFLTLLSNLYHLYIYFDIIKININIFILTSGYIFTFIIINIDPYKSGTHGDWAATTNARNRL